MKILMSLIFVWGATVFAETPSAQSAQPLYRIVMNLKKNGKEWGDMTITTMTGVTGKISQQDDKTKDGSFIEVTPSEGTPMKGKKTVAMSFVVGEYVHGVRKVWGTPKVLSFLNEKAEIQVTAEKPEQVSYALAVTTTEIPPAKH